MKKRYKFLIAFAVLALALWFLNVYAGPRPEQIAYGVTFSRPYAQNLGLDWKEVYTAMLQDLNIKLVRVPLYWNEIEPKQSEYDFSSIDFMVEEAGKYNASLILAIGKRLPRWPECHDPEWAKDLSHSAAQNAQLAYMEAAVRRYSSNDTVTMWQVENEPFLGSFGPCPPLDENFFDSEIAMVKKLDPSRPILITDSGELSLWQKAGSRGDQFGTTYYRYVYSDVLKRYWTNFYFPGWLYRAKAGLVRVLHGKKPVMIAELEAEPWTTKGITNTPIKEQFQTMSMEKFNTITRLAGKTGFSPQILWGVEWWYWMKTQGHSEFWQRAEQLINHK